MRELYKITLSGMPLDKQIKAVDIISEALVEKFNRKVIVVHESQYTNGALEDIPSSTSVFIIGDN